MALTYFDHLKQSAAWIVWYAVCFYAMWYESAETAAAMLPLAQPNHGPALQSITVHTLQSALLMLRTLQGAQYPWVLYGKYVFPGCREATQQGSPAREGCVFASVLLYILGPVLKVRLRHAHAACYFATRPPDQNPLALSLLAAQAANRQQLRVGRELAQIKIYQSKRRSTAALMSR